MGRNQTYNLSFLVVFFNGQREAIRTLHTLSKQYQLKAAQNPYQVIVLDSNSSSPLDPAVVSAYGTNFSYHFVETKHPSPVETLRYGLDLVDTEYCGIMIDGAHMLSPGIVAAFNDIIRIESNACIIVPKYHLGALHQSDAVNQGYNQQSEDGLLESVDWKNNGYELFKISSTEQSEFDEFKKSGTSNCIIAPTKLIKETKIFDKAYYSKGAGLLNFDLFKTLVEHDKMKNFGLIGEASFHQFHGGVSTNAKRGDQLTSIYRKEYLDINNIPYSPASYELSYYGSYNESSEAIKPVPKWKHLRQLLNQVLLKQDPNFYLQTVNFCINKWPFNVMFYHNLIEYYKQYGSSKEISDSYQKALSIRPGYVPFLRAEGKYFFDQKKYGKAFNSFLKATETDPTNPVYQYLLALCNHKLGHKEATVERLNKATTLWGSYTNPSAEDYTDVIASLRELGRITKAYQQTKIAITTFPNNLQLQYHALELSSRLLRQEELLAAEQKITSIQQEANSQDHLMRLGIAHLNASNYKKGIHNFEQFLEKENHNHKGCLVNLSLAYALNNDPESASKALSLCNDLDSEDLKMRRELAKGIVLLKEDKIEASLVLATTEIKKSIYHPVGKAFLLELSKALDKLQFYRLIKAIEGVGQSHYIIDLLKAVNLNYENAHKIQLPGKDAASKTKAS